LSIWNQVNRRNIKNVQNQLNQAIQEGDQLVDLLKSELGLSYDKRVIKNGVRNSDFSEGTNYYSKGSTATWDIIDGKLEVTKATTATTMALALTTDLSYKNGHKYYISTKVTPLSAANSISMILYPSITLSPASTLWNQNNPVIGQEYLASKYIDGLSSSPGNSGDMMYLRILGNYTAGTADSYAIRQFMVFDLTEIYGVGNEPTESEFVAKLNNDFSGFIVRLANDYLNKSSKIQVIESKIESIEQGGGVSRLSDKKIACFGDSNTMKNGSELAYTDVLQDRLGATVYNVGFGGCRMSSHSGGYDAFSMYRLADAIVSGDWSLQDANVSVVSAYAPRLNTLKSIDFSTLDYLTISYGTNDYAADKGLDSVEDPMSSYNYLTSARYSLDKILTAYPNIKIVLLTPIWRARYSMVGDGLNGDIKQNGNSLYLYEFADGLIDLAKEFKVNVIDMYYDLGINRYTSEMYLSDGLHANDTGKTLMGNKISSYFESNF
jgi:lysophospholipase L1-like esterase